MYYRNLTIQGFVCNSASFDRIEPWLRLNPAICLAFAVIGFAYSSYQVFLLMAAFAAVGAIFPHALGDVIYNTLIRHFTKTPALPPNPPPRRFACFVGFLWTLTIVWAFYMTYTTLASVLAIVLIIVIIPMVSIHFCIASEIYQMVIGYKPRDI